MILDHLLMKKIENEYVKTDVTVYTKSWQIVGF